MRALKRSVVWKMYRDERGMEYYRGKLGRITVAFIHTNAIRSADIIEPVLAICSLPGAVKKKRFFTVDEAEEYIKELVSKWVQRANMREPRKEWKQSIPKKEKIKGKREKFANSRIIRG